MKKQAVVLCIMALVLSACGSQSARKYKQQLERYKSLWNTILDEDRVEQSSQYFDIKATMEASGSQYVYSVTIDNPRIAMMNVEVLVLEDESDYSDEKMMVSSGIFDPSRDMIPNQSRANSNFVGGLFLSASTEASELDLRVLVVWKTIDHNEVKREVILVPVKAKK